MAKLKNHTRKNKNKRAWIYYNKFIKANKYAIKIYYVTKYVLCIICF